MKNVTKTIVLQIKSIRLPRITLNNLGYPCMRVYRLFQKQVMEHAGL